MSIMINVIYMSNAFIADMVYAIIMAKMSV